MKWQSPGGATSPSRRFQRHGFLVLALFCLHIGRDDCQPAAAAAESSVSSTQTIAQDAIVRGGMGPVAFLRFSPDGRELVRVCSFGPVMLLDTTNFNKGRTFPVGLRMVAYSPDGTKIATAEGVDGARLWDAAIPGELVTKSRRKEVYVLNTPLQVLEAAPQVQKRAVISAEFSPDGKHLITTRTDGRVKVWDTSSWTLEEEITVSSAEVRAVAVSPDSRTMIFGDKQGVLHEWSFEKKTEIKATPTPGSIASILYGPDGKILVTTHSISNAGVMIWMWGTRGVGKAEQGSSAAFSKDGKILALGGHNIKLIEAASQTAIRTIELPEIAMREIVGNKDPDADKKLPIVVTTLAFSPDGATLAAGCIEGTIRLVKIAK